MAPPPPPAVEISRPMNRDADRSVPIHPPPTRSVPCCSFPVACLQETKLGDRYDSARKIEKAIRRIQPGFRIRVEHFAAILLVEQEDLQHEDEGGHLSHERCNPWQLKRRLEKISPFCKHYMLHLDPRNLDLKHWVHAKPVPLVSQPLLSPEMSYDEIQLSTHYRASFRTQTTIDEVPKNIAQRGERECRERDGYKCVITGRSSPRVFWLIPKGFNDTKNNNNATGNFEAGCVYLTKIDLLDDIHSATELGKTHKVWNMLCVDPAIYDTLAQGLCAFKYIGIEELRDGHCQVQLKFFWMPKLPPRFGQIMDLNAIMKFNPKDNAQGFISFQNIERGKDISADLTMFKNSGCPMPDRIDKREAISTPPLLSGKDVNIKMPKRESRLFKTVIEIHWACVTFTALCGGAGRAWYLIGMNQADGSLQPRWEQYKEDKHTGLTD
ncbi:hypothetical protein FVEN_g4516 [Fusarium venenatum]|uniref:HNH nuclease domain-containing protein n=1 Tax=Fusarium venenatum TaxID=56646 RepID=A0A2L2TDG4_9HYPO|nr:uncharacterized protein FVRRES_02585 [Fusarium venenatum]KAG8357777.1 hypothetical protein FVEN_g4516 [Fusarium venenatum]KAH7004320.1 hypothetical protein EDB82DRAFT_571325 [Fusarium venenatum]CEI66073.1 unnamed protein product [Fusarium venenatum]